MEEEMNLEEVQLEQQVMNVVVYQKAGNYYIDGESLVRFGLLPGSDNNSYYSKFYAIDDSTLQKIRDSIDFSIEINFIVKDLPKNAEFGDFISAMSFQLHEQEFANNQDTAVEIKEETQDYRPDSVSDLASLADEITDELSIRFYGFLAKHLDCDPVKVADAMTEICSSFLKTEANNIINSQVDNERESFTM